MQRDFQNGLKQTIVHLEYCEAERYIYAAFTDFQSLPVLKEACEAALRIIREKGCTKILSDNSGMLGGKDFGYDYILTEFAPKAISYGLKYFAYVTPPAIGNPQTVKKLEVTFPPELEFMLFDTAEEARKWLLSR
ncbi:hypothetical protein I5M27_11590 [Adhaeribacter sp. BT258]|uniref:STAS/SEC14 domain-containing protein n=1 Tax=Adhaeribacter terrigena TaxID=2793070 RepID=A0ABS1C2K4_9BACT|nr:hypothetical protein [Adhaeribacter terrigena]MBK0403631.1 hypothetical protein [Adhaeribacter terrigena]